MRNGSKRPAARHAAAGSGVEMLGREGLRPVEGACRNAGGDPRERPWASHVALVAGGWSAPRQVTGRSGPSAAFRTSGAHPDAHSGLNLASRRLSQARYSPRAAEEAGTMRQAIRSGEIPARSANK